MLQSDTTSNSTHSDDEYQFGLWLLMQNSLLGTPTYIFGAISQTVPMTLKLWICLFLPLVRLTPKTQKNSTLGVILISKVAKTVFSCGLLVKKNEEKIYFFCFPCSQGFMLPQITIVTQQSPSKSICSPNYWAKTVKKGKNGQKGKNLQKIGQNFGFVIKTSYFIVKLMMYKL